MRLFAAITMPDEITQQLKELRQPVNGIRWQKPDAAHLTLRFIGEVNEEAYQSITSELSKIREPAFELKLRGVGYFPLNRYPRVLWVGAEEHPALMSLQNKIEEGCREAGLDADERPFRPHVTLGKVKNASKEEVLSYINKNKDFETDTLYVKEFILYSSRLHPEGAIHTPMRRFFLDSPEQ